MAISLLYGSATFSQQVADQVKRNMITLRQIGYQFLLSMGDSTSRVLTVSDEAPNTHLIGVEKPLSFIPDSLASVVKLIMQPSSHSFAFTICVKRAEKKIVLWIHQQRPKE